MSLVVATLIEANNEAHYKVAIVENPQVHNIFGDTLELVVTDDLRKQKAISSSNLIRLVR